MKQKNKAKTAKRAASKKADGEPEGYSRGFGHLVIPRDVRIVKGFDSLRVRNGE